MSSAFFTILHYVLLSEFSAYQKAFIGKQIFFLFWPLCSGEHHKQKMASDDSVFEKRETLPIFALPPCVRAWINSACSQCWFWQIHQAWFWSSLWSQEWKRKAKWCHLLIVLLLFLSHLYSCLKQPKPGAGCKTSPHPGTKQQNTAWNEGRKHYNTLTTPKL